MRNGHHEARYRIRRRARFRSTRLPVLYGRHIDQGDIDAASNVDRAAARRLRAALPRRRRSDRAERVCRPESLFGRRRACKPPKQGFLNVSFAGEVAIPWTTYVSRYLRGSSLFGRPFRRERSVDDRHVETAVIKQLAQHTQQTASYSTKASINRRSPRHQRHFQRDDAHRRRSSARSRCSWPASAS